MGETGSNGRKGTNTFCPKREKRSTFINFIPTQRSRRGLCAEGNLPKNGSSLRRVVNIPQGEQEVLCASFPPDSPKERVRNRHHSAHHSNNINREKRHHSAPHSSFKQEERAPLCAEVSQLNREKRHHSAQRFLSQTVYTTGVHRVYLSQTVYTTGVPKGVPFSDGVYHRVYIG